MVQNEENDTPIWANGHISSMKYSYIEAASVHRFVAHAVSTKLGKEDDS